MRSKAVFLLILLFLLPGYPSEAQEDSPPTAYVDVALPQSLNDALVIAIDRNYAPLTLLNLDGQPAGIFVDIWRLWSRKTGKAITFIAGNWANTLAYLKNGKADIHSGLFYSDSRAKWIEFSQPFYAVGSFLFFKSGSKGIDRRGDLEGKKIGAIQGSFQEEYLKETYLKSEVVSFTEREEMIRAVLTSKIDCLLSEGPAMAAVLDRFGLTGQFETSPLVFRRSFHAGVLKKNSPLLSLIDKGFDAVSDKELAEIEKHWIFDPDKQYFKGFEARIRLTEQEKAWIEEHPSIRVGFPSDFPPLFFKEDDVIKGIHPDYLGLISAYSGLKFDLVRIPAKTVDDCLRTMKIDMAAAFDIPERKNYVRNTLPVLNITMVIVGRSDMSVIRGLNALKGKKAAIVRGIRIYHQILKDHPDIKIYPTDTFKEALDAVASGKADAVIGGMVMVGHLLHDYPTLKILGLAGIPPQPHVYAVRKDFPQLVNILNKAIVKIPKEETDATIQKWFKVQVQHKADWSTILRWVSGISVVFMIILCIFLYWNKRLAKEVIERKQAEEALRKSEEQKKAILDASIDVIRLVDKDMKIIWANRRTTTEFEVAPEQLVGHSCYDVLAGRDAPCPGCPSIKALKSGKTEYALIRQKELKGIKEETYWYDYAVPIKDESGGIINLIQISRNITDQKRAEQEKEGLEAQLRQAQKMEAIGTLAGGIAHEFNNILGIIIGNNQLALMDIPDWSPAKDCLKEIQEASLRAKDVVRNILSFARKTAAEKNPMQISTIIKESLKLLRASIPTLIEIHQHIECEEAMILGNLTEVNQVLMHLCTNAVHAIGDEAGVLEVNLEPITIDEDSAVKYEGLNPGDFVKLTVKDTGHGIDPGIIERIFDPYFSTKSLAERTGMGLAIVYGIVKKHGGAIRVESEVGKGTIFEVLFPLCEGEAEEELKEEPDALPRGTERILFVDDEPSLVKMAERMLGRLGYDVETKTSSLEALELFQSAPDRFDLVMTDVGMPRMAGDTLARELIKIRPDIPIIICTGYSDRIDEEKAREMGIRGYVIKPFIVRDLAKTLREVLNEK